MLPDFPEVKNRASRDLLRWIRHQVPNVTPIIQGIATFRQHEGRIGTIVRADDSQDTIDYQPSEFAFSLDREEMRRFDLQAIHEKLNKLAKEMGADQSRRLLEMAGKAADSVGNVVHSGDSLTAEKFLEMFSKVQMDFDPRTLQPMPGFMFVMHPDTAARVVPRAKEWEEDPVYKAKYEAILNTKREEWRDREARRKLAD